MRTAKQLTIAFILAAFFLSSLRAADPAEKTDPAAEVKRPPALVVYQRLLEEYQAGTSKGLPTLELLRTWSLRVAEEPIENLQIGFPPPEGAVADVKETIIEAMESHSNRMVELGKIVRVSYKAGKAEYVDVAAVEYYIAESERLPQKFDTLQRALYQTSKAKVTLPEVDPRTKFTSAKEIMVYVDAKGRIKLQGDNLTPEQFERRMQKEKSDHGEISLVLRCDPRVKNRDIVAITDVAGEFAARLSITVVEEPGSEKDE